VTASDNSVFYYTNPILPKYIEDFINLLQEQNKILKEENEKLKKALEASNPTNIPS